MPLDGPQLLKNPRNVYPFQPVANFHVQANIWTGEPAGFPLYRGNNNANAKYLSHPMPDAGQNAGVSMGWGCYFKLNAITDDLYFIVANQAILQVADANIRGYAAHISGSGSTLTVERLNGGGAVTVLGTYAWTPDTDLHCIYLTREVSGANRFWRLYYGTSYDSMALMIGPTATDATYTAFSHWGWDHLSLSRIVCGGEWCQS